MVHLGTHVRPFANTLTLHADSLCSTSRLFVDPELIAKGDDPKFAVAFARIECHYFVHGGFFRVMRCASELIVSLSIAS